MNKLILISLLFTIIGASKYYSLVGLSVDAYIVCIKCWEGFLRVLCQLVRCKLVNLNPVNIKFLFIQPNECGPNSANGFTLCSFKIVTVVLKLSSLTKEEPEGLIIQRGWLWSVFTTIKQSVQPCFSATITTFHSVISVLFPLPLAKHNTTTKKCFLTLKESLCVRSLKYEAHSLKIPVR